jgi:hypothetical protein
MGYRWGDGEGTIPAIFIGPFLTIPNIGSKIRDLDLNFTKK